MASEKDSQSARDIPVRTKVNDDGQPADAPPSYDALHPQQGACQLSLHPLATQSGLFVKIVPPNRPISEKRNSVDITLVIDVSGSMSEEAAMPRDSTGKQLERTGLTILDLTKHAAMAMIENLGPADRLSIVTFSTTAQTVQPLISMTGQDKDAARARIKALRASGATCLWGGIREGLAQFSNTSDQGNTRALCLFTDGRPYGHGSVPQQGWVKAISGLGELPAAIHTFGFGYELEEGLLQSIASLGGGNYSFISDLGMIGTSIIHATANLQTTFARKAMLRITCPKSIGLEPSWISIKAPLSKDVADGRVQYDFDLHTVQYGQPLHRHLWYISGPRGVEAALRSEKGDKVISATLLYHHNTDMRQATASARLDSYSDPSLALAENDIAYHTSRTQAAGFLSRLFPLDSETGMHKPRKSIELSKARELLTQLMRDIPANQPTHRDDPSNAALIKDFVYEGKGQVEQALVPAAWEKWGASYLPSLLCAYIHQSRLSFKDPGTQCFGGELFQELVDSLSTAFDTLPPPEPAIPPYRGQPGGGTHYRKVDMSQLNRASNDCFAGDAEVLLAEGTTMPIRELRSGLVVQTLMGPRKIRTVVRCQTDRSKGRVMCEVAAQGVNRALCVTPWHPISLDGGDTWVFPAELAEGPDSSRAIEAYAEDVYSLLLERDANADAHSVCIDGLWGVTMGHGLVAEDAKRTNDIRNHPFYGNYTHVEDHLRQLPMTADGLTLINGRGGPRDPVTRLVNGFAEAHL